MPVTMSHDPTRLERLAKAVQSVIRELVRSGHRAEDAPDVAQEALIETWKRLDKIAPGAEEAYLHRAARNRGRNYIRTNTTAKRGGGLGGALEDDTDAVDQALSIEDLLVQEEAVAAFHARVAEVMALLPEETRLCLILRKRGASYLEIAQTLGCTAQSARTRVSRGSAFLRERVGPPPAGVSWAQIGGGDDE
jgi:RNA polymerase sigma factor (sigma-70 family)